MCHRCEWALNEPSKSYHDQSWCIEKHEEQALFEWLILEGMQAGLSWVTVLNKRAAMIEAFDRFDVDKICLYTDTDIERLMTNAGIIRSRRKLEALVTNAQSFKKVQAEFGSFDQFIWSFTKRQRVLNDWETVQQMPASSPLSETVSRELKKRGFKFTGPVIIYSYLQAIGVIDDHVRDCSFKTW